MRKSTLKNVRGQVASPRSANGAIGNDPGIRHGLDWCRDVLLAGLADYDKGINAARWAMEHGHSIGEHKANISTSFELERLGSLLLVYAVVRKWNEDRLD